MFVCVFFSTLASDVDYTPPGRDLYCSPCRLYGPTYRSSPHIPLDEVMWQAGEEVIQIPAPSLYKVLGTHQRSKKHKIRGQYERHVHVLEILKQKISRFVKKGWYFEQGTIQRCRTLVNY